MSKSTALGKKNTKHSLSFSNWLVFSVYHCAANITVFRTVSQTKQDILRCHLGLWKLKDKTINSEIYQQRNC